VTYSSKGEVKRNLRSAGFYVKLLPGPPGKREMISAKKI
jgi:tRNA U34 5-methylaminomethyl-2-thiouridine-forming methyltransferase MnmC